MPELPEAETIVRGIRPRVQGRTITRARVVHADVLRVPARRFQTGVRGVRIAGVGRRGKNVVLHLEDGAVIVVNLGMTGRLLPLPAASSGRALPAHPAVVFHLEDGGTLVFDDVRRFGTVEHLDAEAWAARSAAMGPEPLDSRFTAAALGAALGRSRAPVRSWLLDQKRIAGVGNIYAAEALFRAGVHPARGAETLTGEEIRRLHRALRHVLRKAIQAGGTTIRDYRNADGEAGRFAPRLRVYGREGKPCLRCRTPVVRTVFGGRSAYHCPRCQPEEVGRG